MKSKSSFKRLLTKRVLPIAAIHLLLAAILILTGCSEPTYEDEFVMRSRLGKEPWKVLESSYASSSQWRIIVEKSKTGERKQFLTSELFAPGDYVTFEYDNGEAIPKLVKIDLDFIGPKNTQR